LPKRISLRPLALMAFKSSSPKKVKYNPVTSQYDGTNKSTFNTDFATGTSTITPYTYTDPLTGESSTKKELVTDSYLNPELKTAANTASTGLNNNLSYLSMDPNQRVSFLTSGQDPLYNVLNEQANRTFDQNVGRTSLDAAKTGNQNSTALGGALGSLYSNDSLIRNQILLNALNYGNQTANTNAATNLGAIGGLANLSYPLGSAANSSLQSALNQLDSVGLSNAQNQLQADMYNTSAANANRTNWGSVIGSGLGTLASVGLAPFTGGASLLALPSALSSFGSSFGGSGGGGAISGGMGGSGYGYPSSYSNPLSSYSFTNPLSSSGGFSSLNYLPNASYFTNPNYSLSAA
jgi:hypothetical protein